LIATLVVATLAVLAWRSGVIGAAFGSKRASALGGSVSPAAGGAVSRKLRASPAQSLARGSTSNPTPPSTSSTTSSAVDPDVAAVQNYVGLGLPIFCGGGHGNYVALTFDDGPGAYTERTLELLKAARDTATFFLVGKVIVFYNTMPAKERRVGALGDHTWDHVDLTKLPADEQSSEILRTKEAITALTPGPVMLFRPPLGGRDTDLDRVVTSLGMLEIVWAVDSGDSKGDTPQQVYQHVVSGLRPGAIILMHENRGSTLQELPAILEAVKRAGLQTVTVPQLLRLDPPSAEQVKRDVAANFCVNG